MVMLGKKKNKPIEKLTAMRHLNTRAVLSIVGF